MFLGVILAGWNIKLKKIKQQYKQTYKRSRK